MAIKFNGGYPLVICDVCSVIIDTYENKLDEEIYSKPNTQLCIKHKREQIAKEDEDGMGN